MFVFSAPCLWHVTYVTKIIAARAACINIKLDTEPQDLTALFVTKSFTLKVSWMRIFAVTGGRATTFVASVEASSVLRTKRV